MYLSLSLLEDLLEVLLGINIERTLVSLRQHWKLGLGVRCLNPFLLATRLGRLIHASVKVIITAARAHLIRVIVSLFALFASRSAFLRLHITCASPLLLYRVSDLESALLNGCVESLADP